MCIAVPAQVMEVKGMVAIVDFGGVRQNVNITLLDDVKPGDYLLVHCACAIEKLSQKAGKEVLALLEEVSAKVISGEIT